MGYGDVVPVGMSRAIAVAEAAAGMLFFGAVIAKLLSRGQEELLRNLHQLSFEERLGRIQSNLHLLLAEFHAIGDQTIAIDGGPTTRARLSSRCVSATMVLHRELEAVRRLLYMPGLAIEEESLESILITLDAALREFGSLMRRIRLLGVPIHQRGIEKLAASANQICADCVPTQHNESLHEWMDGIQIVADELVDSYGNGNEPISD